MWGFSRELCETDHLQYHKQIVLINVLQSKRLLRKACVAVGSVTSNCIAAPGRGPFHEHLFLKRGKALPWPGPFWRLCALSRTIAETPDFGLKSNTKEDPLPWPGPFQGFPALMEGLRENPLPWGALP